MKDYNNNTYSHRFCHPSPLQGERHPSTKHDAMGAADRGLCTIRRGALWGGGDGDLVL